MIPSKTPLSNSDKHWSYTQWRGSSATQNPTVGPTTNPTRDPTVQPTQSPTSYVCDSVTVEVTHFDGFTAYDLRSDSQSQNLLSDNITHPSIAENSYVESYEFYVEFQSVSEPLLIVQIICALSDAALGVLQSAINTETEEISNEIKLSLIHWFGNGTESESNQMTVNIFLTKFSILHICWNYTPFTKCVFQGIFRVE